MSFPDSMVFPQGTSFINHGKHTLAVLPETYFIDDTPRRTVVAFLPEEGHASAYKRALEFDKKRKGCTCGHG